MSYTQRRYFAHAEQRRREDAEPSPGTPPPDMMLAHSFRASWGPGGTLVFGSRSVRMVQVAPDAAAGNGGDAESTRQRAIAMLRVRVEEQRAVASTHWPTRDVAGFAAVNAGLCAWRRRLRSALRFDKSVG